MGAIDLISEGMAGFFPLWRKKELTKEMLCQKLAEVITPALDDELNCELFISNYIYVTQRAMNDIDEINARLSHLQQLDQSIPSERLCKYTGTSKLYDRKCYGYKNDEEKAKNVKLIFDLYLSGQSVPGIIKELEKQKILSPTGKGKWCKRTIDVMLSNEKYTGDVKLLKSGKSEVQYLAFG